MLCWLRRSGRRNIVQNGTYGVFVKALDRLVTPTEGIRVSRGKDLEESVIEEAATTVL